MRWSWWMTCLWSLCLAACGGDGVQADTPADVKPTGDGGSAIGMSASGTIGGLDKDAVQSVVTKTNGPVNRCVRAGRKRLPFLGGEIRLEIIINRMGRAAVVFPTHSTLGDHEVEKCITGAFRKPQWPRPTGGEIGIVRQGYEFGHGHDEPPLEWSEDALEQKMNAEADGDETPFAEMLDTLGKCRDDAGAGSLTVTFYMDEDGFVQAAGVGMANMEGLEAVECVVTTMQTTSFPAPVHNFAKVTVSVK